MEAVSWTGYGSWGFFKPKKKNGQRNCVGVGAPECEISSLQPMTAGEQCLDTKQRVRKIMQTESLGG